MSWMFVCTWRGSLTKISPCPGKYLQVPREPFEVVGLPLASLNVRGSSYERLSRPERSHVNCHECSWRRSLTRISPGSGNHLQVLREPSEVVGITLALPNVCGSSYERFSRPESSHVNMSWVFVRSRRGRLPKMSPGSGNHPQLSREYFEVDGLTLAPSNVCGSSYKRFKSQRGATSLCHGCLFVHGAEDSPKCHQA